MTYPGSNAEYWLNMGFKSLICRIKLYHANPRIMDIIGLLNGLTLISEES